MEKNKSLSHPPNFHEFTCLSPIPHPLPTSSTPWSNNAALSNLMYPSAPLEEERWAGSSERLKGSQADVEEDRRNALTSSLTTSVLSILHLNHPITPPSGHVTTTTDTAGTVPDALALWLAGRCIHEPLSCLTSSSVVGLKCGETRAQRSRSP